MTQFLGWSATILFTIALIPQIIKTISLKSTRGVSPWLFILTLTANCIALSYAFKINQSPLIIKYALGITVTLFYLLIYITYYQSND